MSNQSIGGFLELELPQALSDGSVWDKWTENNHQLLKLSNARSAIAEILKGLGTKRAWLPAFSCKVMADATQRVETLFYSVDKQLKPDIDQLENQLKSDDVVIGIDYFGGMISDEFQQLKQARPDIVWIEDRAQALDPGPPWGDWLVYSPRKLFGVPDGGIGVCLNENRKINTPAYSSYSTLKHLEPLYLRFIDTQFENNENWYQSSQDSERAMGVHQFECSNYTLEMLKRFDLETIRQKRKTNTRIIYKELGDYCLMQKEHFTGPALCIPIISSHRDYLAQELAKQGVFCAKHWVDLPSPIPSFPTEHLLSRQVLSLPCDQRYSEDDIHRTCSLVKKIIQAI